MRWNVVTMFAISVVTGCTTADQSSSTPGPVVHVDEVARSTEWSQHLDRLHDLGWQVAPLITGVEVAEGDRWRVEVPATNGALAIDVIFVHDGGERVVVRPHDRVSAQAFSDPKDVEVATKGLSQAVGYCDEGCYPSPDRVCNCQYWSCSFIEGYSYTWGCVAFPDNVWGQTFNMVYRGGSTDPASCAGWWSDAFGHTKVCPWPARQEYHWSVCAQFIDG